MTKWNVNTLLDLAGETDAKVEEDADGQLVIKTGFRADGDNLVDMNTGEVLTPAGPDAA